MLRALVVLLGLGACGKEPLKQLPEKVPGPQGQSVPHDEPPPGDVDDGDPVVCSASSTDLEAWWDGCGPFQVELAWAGGAARVEVWEVNGDLVVAEVATSPLRFSTDRATTLAWAVTAEGCTPAVGPWVVLDAGRHWRQNDEAPPPRAGHAVAANGTIVVVGGYDAAGDLADVWSSSDGVTWQRAIAEAPFGARRWLAAAWQDERLWVVAGNRGGGSTNLGDVWSSSDGTGWSLANEAAVPPRHAPVLLSFDGALWVIGGEGPNCQSRADVYRSQDGESWELVTANAGFVGRDWHAGAVLDGRMWIAGGAHRGLGCESDYLDDVWSSADGVSWTLEAAGEFPARAGHALVSDGERLWVIGGTTAWPVATQSDVWYSDDGCTWCRATEAHAFSNRYDHGAAALGQGLWVIGGFDGDFADDVWRSP